MTVIAIGGGEIRKGETLKLDRRIVDRTGMHRPKALFLPTASGDSDGYIEAFDKLYGKRLGCEVMVLRLIRGKPSQGEIRDKIQSSDLVYVGGGNTLRMMKLWRKAGVDNELRKASARGCVLSGLSAGAMCWFRYGHSDSRSFSGQTNWKYIRVRGLDLIPMMYCPHYRRERRQRPLAEMILKCGGCAIACDNNTAVEIGEGKVRALVGTDPRSGVFIVHRRGGKAVRRKLTPEDGLIHLESLTKQ